MPKFWIVPMATNQTTTYQNFGHALGLVMAIFWWGKVGLEPSRLFIFISPFITCFGSV
jgi:hypothetical protein